MAKVLIRGMHYEVVEAGQGEPVLLLHGFTGSSANWQAHIDVFASELRVLAVDLPGHGATDAPPELERYYMETVAGDLIALLDTLAISKVHLSGYSMGGRLALYTAIHYPERVQSLILESASPGLETDAERLARVRSDEALARKIEQQGVAAFIREWEQLPLFATQSELMKQQLHELRLQNRAEGLANSLRGMGTGVQPSLWGKLPELRLPVLLLAGALDTKFTGIARKMQTLLPHAELQVVPDVGHTIHLENPTYFDLAVLEFVRRTSPG